MQTNNFSSAFVRVPFQQEAHNERIELSRANARRDRVLPVLHLYWRRTFDAVSQPRGAIPQRPSRAQCSTPGFTFAISESLNLSADFNCLIFFRSLMCILHNRIRIKIS
jgi:hypothetical protein